MASSYLNPGFTGSQQYHKIYFQQRLQWPGLDAKYISTMAGFDLYSSKYKSGFGLYTIFDYQGVGQMTSKEVQLQYAYEVPVTEKLVFRPGLQFGIVNRSLDDSRLVFPDQYGKNGYIGATQDNIPNENILYPDISSGFLLFSPRIWFGASMHHMNRPNVSYFSDSKSRWPAKISLVGGYKIVLANITGGSYLNDDLSIVPTFHYKTQGKSDQIDFGAYFNYQFLVLGIWYRGIPVFKYYLPELQNNESVAFLIGLRIDRWRAGYSYDQIVSELTPAQPVGAHEISLSYTLSPRSKKRPGKTLPCPEF